MSILIFFFFFFWPLVRTNSCRMICGSWILEHFENEAKRCSERRRRLWCRWERFAALCCFPADKMKCDLEETPFSSLLSPPPPIMDTNIYFRDTVTFNLLVGLNPREQHSSVHDECSLYTLGMWCAHSGCTEVNFVLNVTSVVCLLLCAFSISWFWIAPLFPVGPLSFFRLLFLLFRIFFSEIK